MRPLLVVLVQGFGVLCRRNILCRVFEGHYAQRLGCSDCHIPFEPRYACSTRRVRLIMTSIGIMTALMALVHILKLDHLSFFEICGAVMGCFTLLLDVLLVVLFLVLRLVLIFVLCFVFIFVYCRVWFSSVFSFHNMTHRHPAPRSSVSLARSVPPLPVPLPAVSSSSIRSTGLTVM